MGILKNNKKDKLHTPINPEHYGTYMFYKSYDDSEQIFFKNLKKQGDKNNPTTMNCLYKKIFQHHDSWIFNCGSLPPIKKHIMIHKK